MFKWFESRINPYPEQLLSLPEHGLFAFIRVCLVGVKFWIFLLLIFAAVIGVFEAYLFSLMGMLIDWMTTLGPDQLWLQKKSELLIILGIILLSPLIIFISSTINFQVVRGNMPMLLRWHFHRLMLNQSMGFYQDEFAGRISAKVLQTAQAVRDTVLILADMLVFIVIYFITCALILSRFDMWLLAPFGVWLGLFLITIYYFIPRLSLTAKNQADARSLMSGRMTDAYANIASVKLFSYAQRESDYAKAAMQELMGTTHAQLRLLTQFESINHGLNMLLIATTAILAIYLWQLHLTSIGAVAASIAMALRLNGMSHWIMWELAQLFENIGTVQDGMATLTRPQLVVDKLNAPKLFVTQGKVEFKSIKFNYNYNHTNNINLINENLKNDAMAINADINADINIGVNTGVNIDNNVDQSTNILMTDFNLVIHAGEKIGLVGRSGAGKSTLVNLLLRFYDLQAGQILIDDQDISTVTQDSLRAQIGMVTQDTSLLHRSVHENIAYGRPDATQAMIENAAKLAKATEFIAQLKDLKGQTGFDAQVGERGVKLSGGQRQRIAIARVILKDAPILLLDEATSALDSEVELAIQNSLYQLMQGKTVIAIAHRLSTIAKMDRLIVLDKGQIIEQGTHQQLLAQDGLYAHLWAHQSGGFLGE